MKLLLKLLFLLLFIIYTTKLMAQKSLYQNISEHMCGCIGAQKQALYEPENNVMENCFEKVLQHYTSQILSETDTSQSPESYGTDLGQRISLDLIRSCPVFFNFVDSSRYLPYLLQDKDKLKENLRIYTFALKQKNEEKTLLYKGVTEIGLSEYSAAAQTFVALYKQMPLNIQAIYLCGLSYELNRQYNKALYYYKKILQIEPGNQAIDMSVLIVNQKKKLRK